jgi:HTH-type transcriptional regulator/antitoxin HigA
MKTKTRLRFADLPRNYGGLCVLLPPRPIRDVVDSANVSEVTDALVLWQDELTADQRDYFDLLCSLLEDYDAAHTKWPDVTGTDMLKHLLTEHGLNAAGLSRILGASRNLGAMILRGERNLTLAHVRKLAAHFKVNPELFL